MGEKGTNEYFNYPVAILHDVVSESFSVTWWLGMK
jgi:hypothetical protein